MTRPTVERTTSIVRRFTATGGLDSIGVVGSTTDAIVIPSVFGFLGPPTLAVPMPLKVRMNAARHLGRWSPIVGSFARIVRDKGGSWSRDRTADGGTVAPVRHRWEGGAMATCATCGTISEPPEAELPL